MSWSNTERVIVRAIQEARSTTASRATVTSPGNARTTDHDLPDTTTLQQWLGQHDELSNLPVKIAGVKRLTTVGDVALFMDRDRQLRGLPVREQRMILGLFSWIYGPPILQPHIPTICGIHPDDMRTFFAGIDYDPYKDSLETIRKHFGFAKLD